MAYIETIVDRKYEELKIVFDQIDHNKAIVVTALSLERLWTAFVDDIDTEEYPGLVELQDACMKMMWNRVMRENVLPNEYADYKQMEETMDRIMDPDQDGNGPSDYGCYLWTIFPDAAYCFFDPSGKGRAGVATNPLQMIATNIYDTCDDSLLSPEAQQRYVAFLETHPAILDEIARIDSDVALANLYPENLDAILARKDEYHNLKLVPVSAVC